MIKYFKYRNKQDTLRCIYCRKTDAQIRVCEDTICSTRGPRYMDHPHNKIDIIPDIAVAGMLRAVDFNDPSIFVPGDKEKILAPLEDLKLHYANNIPTTAEQQKVIDEFWAACYKEYEPTNWRERIDMWLWKVSEWWKK